MPNHLSTSSLNFSHSYTTSSYTSYSVDNSPFSSRDRLLSDSDRTRAISGSGSGRVSDSRELENIESGLGAGTGDTTTTTYNASTTNNATETETATETEPGTEPGIGMAWFTIRSQSNDNINDAATTENWPNSHSRSRPRKVKMMSKRRRMALVRSYAVDWVICIVLAGIFFALDAIEGFKRQFSIDDTSLRFPFAEHERVPPVALYFIALVAPEVIQVVVNLLTIRSLWDFHNSSLGLLLSLTLTGAVTQFSKVTVGRPRPDVISRCQPTSGVTNPEYGLVTVEICTQTDVHIIRDGFRSFPSGHSSLSFAGLGFLSFYLAGKMHLFDEKGHTTKAWISLAPLSGAALVAISRTMDYRHHWQDVLVGSLLGLAMSFFAYRQYYPPLSSPYAHRPFSPRIRREGSRDRDDDGGVERERSPSEDSHVPILPTVRPGYNSGLGDSRQNQNQTNFHDTITSAPPGGVGGHDYDRAEVITHPVVPHVHPIHGGHPHDYDSRSREQYSPGQAYNYTARGVEVEDLQHGGKRTRTEENDIPISMERHSASPSPPGSYEGEGVELSGTFQSKGSGRA